jgi:hypothetical protein
MCRDIESIEKEIEIVLRDVQAGEKSVQWAKFQLLNMLREREEFFKHKMDGLLRLLEEVDYGPTGK